jgi:hypothetical protein
MKKTLIVFITFTIILIFSLHAIAQFIAEEVAEREKWEEFLKTAELQGLWQMKSRNAVTKPWKITLKQDDITRDALWKDIEGWHGGFLENWRYEIAAYLLDKYLELNMIPPTVERVVMSKRGSCQLWVEYKMSLKESIKQQATVPRGYLISWNKATYLQRAFDNLIANEDRHQGNILITKDWCMILIDHSRSFRSIKTSKKELIFLFENKETKYFIMLPKAFIEKIKTLDFMLLKDIAGKYLKTAEIKAIIARKELILNEIDRLIKKYGEDKVLY